MAQVKFLRASVVDDDQWVAADAENEIVVWRNGDAKDHEIVLGTHLLSSIQIFF